MTYTINCICVDKIEKQKIKKTKNKKKMSKKNLVYTTTYAAHAMHLKIDLWYKWNVFLFVILIIYNFFFFLCSSKSCI